MAEDNAGGPYLMPEPDNDCWFPRPGDPARTAAILATGIRWHGNASISGALVNPRVVIGGTDYPLTVVQPPQA